MTNLKFGNENEARWIAEFTVDRHSDFYWGCTSKIVETLDDCVGTRSRVGGAYEVTQWLLECQEEEGNLTRTPC